MDFAVLMGLDSRCIVKPSCWQGVMRFMNLVEAYDATHTPRLPTEAPPLSDAADDERSVVDERATSSPPIGGGVPMLLEVPQRACGAPSPSKVADGDAPEDAPGKRDAEAAAANDAVSSMDLDDDDGPTSSPPTTLNATRIPSPSP